MAELDNIQNQLHLMLRQYVENKRQTGETIVGGEIPYPTLIVFVGNKICNEALNGILPEMKRHWPTSFASSGMGRLLYLLIDRNSDLKIEDECGEHCSLTSPNPLKSLADNTDDCGAINKCIRNLCLKGNTIKDVKDMRIVAVTDVGDADSLITGEVLALSRQFCKMLLNQTTNEGELFAFLPHNITVSEVEYNQSYEFFVKWKDWNDSKGEFPRIFMRFENSTKRGPVKDGIPAVCHTMIFDSVDNRGIPVTDGWRNRLMVDVLELSRPMDTESIHTPGEIEKTISKEYILLKAMDPANWAMPLGYEEIPWESADELKSQMVKEIVGANGNDVNSSIVKWLRRACVSKLCENDKIENCRSIEELERVCFGKSIKRMFMRFKKEFMSMEVPDHILKKISQIKNEKQVETTKEYLKEIADATEIEKIPDKGEYPKESGIMLFNMDNIWDLRDEKIIPSYIKLAPLCIDALVHRWAIKCRDALIKKAGKGERGDAYSVLRFTEIYRHELISESKYWDINYSGPQMKAPDRKAIDEYKEAIRLVMADPTEENFYRLFKIVENGIENDNAPSIERVRAACQPADALEMIKPAGARKIRNGVSRGKEIKFSVVRDLNYVRYISDCNAWNSDE